MTLSALQRITLKLFGSRSGRRAASSGRTTSLPPGCSRNICPAHMSDLNRGGRTDGGGPASRGHEGADQAIRKQAQGEDRLSRQNRRGMRYQVIISHAVLFQNGFPISTNKSAARGCK